MTRYKYVAPDRIDVLEAGLLRFTPPTALNDPFELKPFFSSFVPEAEIDDQLARGIDITDQVLEIYDSLPEDSRAVISREQYLTMIRSHLQSPEGEETINQALGFYRQAFRELTPVAQAALSEGFASKVGILSLSEVPDSAPMWTHYAAEHAGFVIAFDDGHSFFDRRRTPRDEFYHLRRVIYQTADETKAMTELTGDDVLLRKEPDWSYEREWRVLAPLSTATRVVPAKGDDIHLFAFPADCVEGVILGARCSPELRQRLTSLLQDDSRYERAFMAEAALDQRRPRVSIRTVEIRPPGA